MKLARPDAYSVRHIVENLRDADRESLTALAPDPDEDALAADILTKGPFSFVAWHDNPIAIFGAHCLRPGVYGAFMWGTDEINDAGLPLAHFIKWHLIPAIENTGAHRCEALAMSEHWRAHRWLRLLGAVEEANFARYGRDRQDFTLFRWDLHGSR